MPNHRLDGVRPVTLKYLIPAAVGIGIATATGFDYEVAEGLVDSIQDNVSSAPGVLRVLSYTGAFAASHLNAKGAWLYGLGAAVLNWGVSLVEGGPILGDTSVTPPVEAQPHGGPLTSEFVLGSGLESAVKGGIAFGAGWGTGGLSKLATPRTTP